MSVPPIDNHDLDEKKRRISALIQRMHGAVKRGSELANEPEHRHAPPIANLGALFANAEPLGKTSGEAWRVQWNLPLDGTEIPSGAYLPGNPDDLQALDLAFAPAWNPGLDLSGIERDAVVFLDVETTGLMGGTGTYPFLVGLGFFAPEAFIVEQYFMEDFPYEATMLEALAQRLSEFQAIVTFNGRTFDAPLLRTRFLMNRMPSAVEQPHLDLLHPARRLWRGRLPSCRFSVIEREIFRMRRISDVPGALVPQIYLDYAKGIRREQIIPVIDHNVQDIASMPALLALFSRFMQQPDCEQCAHATDQLGLASWFRRLGETDRFIECVERAVLCSREPDEERRLAMHLAAIYRRLGRWDEALEIWRSRATMAEDWRGIEPCIEMAKFFEHRDRNFREALAWAERALACCSIEPSGHLQNPRGSGLIELIEKRIERLRARIARGSGE